MTATITINIRNIREGSLAGSAAHELDADSKAFDGSVGEYLDHIRKSLASDGIELEVVDELTAWTERASGDTPEEEQAAELAIERGAIPDFWNWYN